MKAVQDYEPFGSLLPGRNYSSDSYRYGFNGQEKDNEVYGSEGTSYTAEFWQYDPRVARRWNLDPVDQVSVSNYAVFGLNPIMNIDANGKNPAVAIYYIYEGVTVALVMVGAWQVSKTIADAAYGTHYNWSSPLFESRKYKDNPGYRHQRRQERMYEDFARLRDMAMAKSIQENLPNPGPNGDDPDFYKKIARTVGGKIGKGGAIILGTVEVLKSMRDQASGEKVGLEKDLAEKQAYVKSKEGTTMTFDEQTKFDALNQFIIPSIQDKIQSRQDVIDFTDDLIKQSQSMEDYNNPGIMRQDNTRVGSGISGGQ